jgi:hypothetical protein
VYTLLEAVIGPVVTFGTISSLLRVILFIALSSQGVLAAQAERGLSLIAEKCW